ncbi:uncharacterized protein N7443_007845 [Penicillium atrosanguineum]|uniref:uncharacterized protein n=1 Tax=Penicillium atrosanguineum TaxID=1132637 RepID=UPI00239DB723|nr:uncharacterized protein N7443_007845 [Penicillium atrosanguineum]KAJ5296952.1 hypothetical protein N7443_007845 [Penicillium atrosanguineum]
MQPHHLFATLALALPALASASTSVLGCYSSVPSLKDEGRYTFQSQGYCEEKCQSGGFRIAALTGLQCLCGNELPPSSAQVDDDKCDTVCAGWPEDNSPANTPKSPIPVPAPTPRTPPDSTPASASTAAGGIVVAPTNINPSSVPTAILTAPSSTVPSASASAIASKSVAAAAITSVSSSTSASPTMNAANSMHAGSSVIGAAIAGLGLLL